MRIDRIKLIVLMAECDMTLGRLAELSRLSISTICQVKAGKSCTPKTGNAIAKALGVPVDELEMGRDYV